MAKSSTKTKKKKKKGSESGNGKTMESQSAIPGPMNIWSQGGLVPWAKHQFPMLRDGFQHAADRVWNFAEDELFSGSQKPAVDIAETENSYIIAMDVPGFDADEIDIQISDHTITIRSMREDESAGEFAEQCSDTGECCEGGSVKQRAIQHRSERPSGNFSRTFALPGEVVDDATAECRNGVLTITLQKTQNTRSRKVKVAR